MNKLQAIELHGNTFLAHDASETYKPMALCYADDYNVLVYNISTNKYHFVKYLSEDDYKFKINNHIYSLDNFVRTDSMAGLGIETIEEWKHGA